MIDASRLFEFAFSGRAILLVGQNLDPEVSEAFRQRLTKVLSLAPSASIKAGRFGSKSYPPQSGRYPLGSCVYRDERIRKFQHARAPARRAGSDAEAFESQRHDRPAAWLPDSRDRSVSCGAHATGLEHLEDILDAVFPGSGGRGRFIFGGMQHRKVG